MSESRSVHFTLNADAFNCVAAAPTTTHQIAACGLTLGVSSAPHPHIYSVCHLNERCKMGRTKTHGKEHAQMKSPANFFFLFLSFKVIWKEKKNADKIKRTSRCGVQRDQLCRLQPTNQSHTAMCNGFRSIKVVRIGLSLIRKANFQPVTWVKSTTRARFHCRT